MLFNLALYYWLIIALFVWLSIVTTLTVRSMLHYKQLTKGVTKKDLKTVLTETLNLQENQGKHLAEIEALLKKHRESAKSHIQKIGFVRFNPFPQTGGDQSFSLALLDENNHGFVLSSLHSRDATRFYAKTVKAGKGDGYDLSKEEQKAISQAK